MSKFLYKFKNLFTTNPYLANSIVYGSLFCGAEFSQQFISRKLVPLNNIKEPLDYQSIGRYAIFGTLIQSPILTTWYRFLDKKVIGTSFKIVTKKVLIDQFLMTPHLVWIFFVAMSIMENKEIFKECKEKFVPTFKTSCLFWLPAQTLNFAFIPSPFRVVYIGTCSLIWVNILCYIKRKTLV